MKTYPQHEYPTPMIFKHIDIGADEDAFLTIQFHTVAEGEDFVLDVDPDAPQILAGAPHGNLLVAIWADDDGKDLIASTVFSVDCEKFVVTESWVKVPWCPIQLRNNLEQRAKHVLEEHKLVEIA